MAPVVERLREISRTDRQTFLVDEILQAATVRYLHTAIESLIDIANHVVAREGFGVARCYQEAVSLLVQNELLPDDHPEARAVHLYDETESGEVTGS